ncbi:MAG TPA: enoyl-CoA hydratase-related protein [Acidimicrobiia bacterium]|nr:enoyl-CoA hydratase-related protein [Acidimicrobiia bacterium]
MLRLSRPVDRGRDRAPGGQGRPPPIGRRHAATAPADRRRPGAQPLLRGTLVSADEAYRVGLATEICAPDELDKRVDALAGELAALPPATMREIKHCGRQATSVSLDVGLALEEDAQLRLRDTNDAHEGVLAFVEKRAPRFTGD